MPPFRFHIPFFSYGSPSRLSSGTSSPSPPPTPPSRPPFRPAGIAQPSKPATSSETKSKMPPSLSRAKSNVAALVASLSGSQSPSRGVASPTRLAKQSNSPLKKPESLKTEVEKRVAQEKKKVLRKDLEGKSETTQGQHKIQETESNQQSGPQVKKPEQKVKMKEKLSREVEKEAGKNINPEIEKPPVARLVRKDAEEVQEQRNKTELEKLVEQEKKKVLNEDNGQKKKETEKLAVQETKRDLQAVGKEDATRSRTTRHITAASDHQERKTQNRAEIHTGENQQKAKGVNTRSHGEGTSSMSKKIKEDIRDGVSMLTWGKSNNDDEKSVSVYTLTGENRGATMAIASDKDKKNGEVHIRRGYRSNPSESPNTSTETEGERKPYKGQNPKDNKEEARFRAHMNGNSQGINNSIVLESSVRENDPGIHMSLKFEESKKETIKPPENVPEKKPEVKNEPRVRRRCLRGLLAESSDSENPLKPRRHGCRFTCKDKDLKNT